MVFIEHLQVHSLLDWQYQIYYVKLTCAGLNDFCDCIIARLQIRYSFTIVVNICSFLLFESKTIFIL